jgi:6-phosphogluconolactonase
MAENVFVRNDGKLWSAIAACLGGMLRETLAVKGSANLAVVGGRSVAAVFDALLSERVDWTGVHMFMADERLVPEDHADSNFRLLRSHLVDHLARTGRMAAANAHPFPYDPGSPDCGAAAYGRVLAGHGSRFDVLLLSAGEDGHVASLFPHHPAMTDARRGFMVLRDAPKPPPGRMTASVPLLLTAPKAILLFLGESKRDAYAGFGSAGPVEACPARLVHSIEDAVVFTDLG